MYSIITLLFYDTIFYYTVTATLYDDALHICPHFVAHHVIGRPKHIQQECPGHSNLLKMVVVP